jgi:hypothetical protein
MNTATGAFTLQDTGFATADSVATRWLTFMSGTLEQDFVRFRGRGHDAITVFLIVAGALSAVFKLPLTPQTPLTSMFLLVGLTFCLLGIPAFVVGTVCARQPEDGAARPSCWRAGMKCSSSC